MSCGEDREDRDLFENVPEVRHRQELLGAQNSEDGDQREERDDRATLPQGIDDFGAALWHRDRDSLGVDHHTALP